MTDGKRLLLKCFGVGVGIGVGLGLVAVAFLLYHLAPPKPEQWNAKAITATFESADYEAKPSPAVYVTYSLQNNTKADFTTTLSSDGNLASNLRAGAERGPIPADSEAPPSTKNPSPSLEFGSINVYLAGQSPDEQMASLSGTQTLFIPSKQRIRVVLRWEFPSEELSAHTSASIVNTSLFGFVLYDDASRYEIDFPRPAAVQGKFTKADIAEPTQASKVTAPDRGDVFDKVAACNQAEQLVPSCKLQNISPPRDSFAAYGGFSTPLPTLPELPKGATLEPSVEACNVAYQWKNYCSAHK